MNQKKLYRKPAEGMLGGVCAGLGDYLDMDPTVIRIVFVLLAFAGLSGVPIYLIMWLLVPLAPAAEGIEFAGAKIVEPGVPADPAVDD